VLLRSIETRARGSTEVASRRPFPLEVPLRSRGSRRERRIVVLVRRPRCVLGVCRTLHLSVFRLRVRPGTGVLLVLGLPLLRLPPPQGMARQGLSSEGTSSRDSSRGVPFPFDARARTNPRFLGLPHRVCSVLRVSHPLDGLLLARTSSLVRAGGILGVHPSGAFPRCQFLETPRSRPALLTFSPIRLPGSGSSPGPVPTADPYCHPVLPDRNRSPPGLRPL